MTADGPDSERVRPVASYPGQRRQDLPVGAVDHRAPMPALMTVMGTRWLRAAVAQLWRDA